MINNAHWLNLAVALGIGLLIGAERERKKADTSDRRQSNSGSSAVAGVRTFTIASLLGAVSTSVNFYLLIASILCVTIFVAAATFVTKDEDPSLTTQVSLIFTVILGGLAMSDAALAASLAVAAAILLAAKEPIHWFVRGAISKEEMMDFLTLAAATLIVLPLVPNEMMGPFDAINPRNLWLIVIFVMLIGALGHLALRLLGIRAGLPIVGLVSGFISSIAAIGAMGARARKTPALLRAAVAGATLSSLSTILFLAMLLVAIHPPTLLLLAGSLTLGGLSIAAYGLLVTFKAFHYDGLELSRQGRSFSVKTALLLACAIAVVLILSAALKLWFGQAGLIIASVVTGLVDTRAASISIASLAAAEIVTPINAAVPILVAFSVNALSKAVTAVAMGGGQFARQVILGLVLQVTAVWLGWLLF